MSEHAIQNAIRNALAGECLLFRANVGQAWTGSKVDRLQGNRVLIHDARPFTTGLPTGFADTFGLVDVIITPEMVGKTLGVFLAGEIKTPTGRASKQQANFLAAIKSKGGAADVWRSVEDAQATLRRVRGF